MVVVFFVGVVWWWFLCCFFFNIVKNIGFFFNIVKKNPSNLQYPLGRYEADGVGCSVGVVL